MDFRTHRRMSGAQEKGYDPPLQSSLYFAPDFRNSSSYRVHFPKTGLHRKLRISWSPLLMIQAMMSVQSRTKYSCGEEVTNRFQNKSSIVKGGSLSWQVEVDHNAAASQKSASSKYIWRGVFSDPATWPAFNFWTDSFHLDNPTTVGFRWSLPVISSSIGVQRWSRPCVLTHPFSRNQVPRRYQPKG